MFAEMRRAGVKVLAGSDLPVAAGVPPIHDELVALVRAGTTPVEALQASTRNAADFLGRLAGEGTVEVGKKANLVLLEADPLADIANTRRIAAVVKILRTANGDVVLTVSGRLTADNVSDLSALIAAEPAGRTIVLDLKDIVLVDRAIVRFLRESEAAILLESK